MKKKIIKIKSKDIISLEEHKQFGNIIKQIREKTHIMLCNANYPKSSFIYQRYWLIDKHIRDVQVFLEEIYINDYDSNLQDRTVYYGDVKND